MYCVLNPSRPSLQASARIISTNLATVTEHLARHHDLFASLSVFPLPSYPGRTQEDLLLQLVRKKLEPDIEDWVAQATALAENAISTASHSYGGMRQAEDYQELWKWAGEEAKRLSDRHDYLVVDYTVEELEGEGGYAAVDTGLKRKLRTEPPNPDKDDDEDDEDGDGNTGAEEDEETAYGLNESENEMALDGEEKEDLEKRETAKKPTVAMPMGAMMRFMVTGERPAMSAE